MQTIKGFGTSACWWSQYCTGKAAEDIAELLYGNSGLALNIYRYNVGGGTDEGNCRVTNSLGEKQKVFMSSTEKKKMVIMISLLIKMLLIL